MELSEIILSPSTICIIVGIVSAFYYRKMNTAERMVLLIIYLNIIADSIAVYMGHYLRQENGIVYNIFGPAEKVITLMIYYLNSTKTLYRKLNIAGIILVVFLSIGGFLILPPISFHNEIYIISGFIISILSYLQLRQIIQATNNQSTILFFFGIANLFYYTLMVSSVSAMPVAWEISKDFGRTILLGNQIAYGLWSIFILIGILWNRKKI